MASRPSKGKRAITRTHLMFEMTYACIYTLYIYIYIYDDDNDDDDYEDDDNDDDRL